jgi:hypothetical protein
VASEASAAPGRLHKEDLMSGRFRLRQAFGWRPQALSASLPDRNAAASHVATRTVSLTAEIPVISPES